MPLKTIKTRYSKANITSNTYGAIHIHSGNTNTSDQGMIYLPYIMKMLKPIIMNSSKWEREMLREERTKKLNELNNL